MADEASDRNDLSGDREEEEEEEEEESGASWSNTTQVLSSASADTPPHFINRESAVGIGGSTGVVYDVNKLKRNLVQESVRGCKEELLLLLGSGRQDVKSTTRNASGTAPRWRRDRDDFIEERLAALVQANPVSTTTDSNLLDGAWSFAFKSHSASTILDTTRFLLSKTKRPLNTSVAVSKDSNSASRGGPWRFRTGKTENPFRSSTRQINLENLSADENAHVIDQNRVLGGLFQSTRRYDVYGLTRTALDLDLAEIETRIFGICLSFKSRKDIAGTDLGQPIEIQVLYLDSDLCVTTGGIGLTGPLHVYTKSEEWVSGGAQRKLRLIVRTAEWLASIQSPFRIRQRLMSTIEAVTNRRDANSRQRKVSDELSSINIGELDIDEDGNTKEDPAWDGEDDPFMHLSPNERMDVLRKMSLDEIYQSAVERKQENNKKRRKSGIKFSGSK